MTTYAKDFSDEGTTGIFATDFTARFAAMSEWTIEAPTDAEDDRVFQAAASGTGLQLASWDDIDGDANRANSEIICRYRNSADQHTRPNLFLRASGSGGNEAGYDLMVDQFGQLEINRWAAGVQTELLDGYVSGNQQAPRYMYTMRLPYWNDAVSDVWQYMRFRVNGTGATVTVQAKHWIDGINGLNEPPWWEIDFEDTSGSRITAAGWTGVGSGTAHGGVLDIDYFGVGTNGDTALINASTNTTVRMTRLWAEIAGTEANPDTQLTNIVTEVLGRATNPNVQVTTCWVQVLHQRVPPVSTDVSGQLIVTT